MAVIKLILAPVNITNKLMVIARKVSNPTVEAAREAYNPEDLVSAPNIVVPAAGVLDAGTYYVDFRESSDGVSLGQLHSTIVYDAKNQRPISETRFYQAGGTRDIDPVPDQTDLIDPYLDGKNITEVHKEAYGPLAPPTEGFKQYDLIAGGGIRLLNGQVFNANEVVVITITYVLSFDDSGSNAGLYNGIIKISTNTTLTSAHRNNRLKCEALSSRLVITLEDIATVPIGRFYQFSCNSGTQKKVRILAVEGDIIRFAGEDRTEISIGLGESVRLEKYGDDTDTYWEAINASPFIAMVGEVIHKGSKDAIGAIPADGATLFDGDDEPRLWEYINSLPITHVLTDDNVINSGYLQPSGKEGMYVKHSSAKKFRTPNTRGWMFKGLNDYTTYNFDTTNRPIDYPGGTEANKVGEHFHFGFHDNGTTNLGTALSAGNFPEKRQGAGAGIGNASAEYNITGGPTEPNVGKTSRANVGSKNKVDNIGTVYMIRS
jgi:hypothetical protein